MMRPPRGAKLREKEAMSPQAKYRLKWGVGIAGVGVAAIVIVGFFLGWFGGTIGGGVTQTYGIRVYNLYTGKSLTSANITYWDSLSNGLPDDAIASGTMDNVTMINFWKLYPSQDVGRIWASVELAGYQTVWSILNTKGQNDIAMLALPEGNGTGTLAHVSNGTAWQTNTTIGDAVVTFTFSTALNGSGFRPTFLADTNTTNYIALNFTFNNTASLGMVTTFYNANGVSNEVTAYDYRKAVDGNSVIVHLSDQFVIGKTALTNYFKVGCTIEFLPATRHLLSIELMYGGVVYATYTAPEV